MRHSPITFFSLLHDQPPHLPQGYTQYFGSHFGCHAPGVDLMNYMYSLQFCGCQCYLLFHKVTFSLNSYEVSISLNINKNIDFA
jgi:hypothetical protein